MASENEFFLLGGNSYRGSRYSNFSGAGTDTQGNVSQVTTEGAQNDISQTPSANTPQVSRDVMNVSSKGVELGPTAPEIPSLGKQATNLVIGAALPYAGSTIGSAAGSALASGSGFGEALGSGIQHLGSKVSAGLLGSSASQSATNAILSAPASSSAGFGAASSTGGSGASNASNIGGNIGAGVGTAAATLLTGGSVGDAALQGTGAYIGSTIGAPFGPIGMAVGSFIGSTIGGFISKTLGIGGDRRKRDTIGANFEPDESGRYTISSTGQSNKATPAISKQYAESVQGILNNFADSLGINYKSGFVTSANIGAKDTGTWYGTSRERITSTGGDPTAVALSLLKDREKYEFTKQDDGFASFWDSALAEATSLKDLASKTDNFFTSRNLTFAPAPNAQMSIARRAGDRYATFYG